MAGLSVAVARLRLAFCRLWRHFSGLWRLFWRLERLSFWGVPLWVSGVFRIFVPGFGSFPWLLRLRHRSRPSSPLGAGPACSAGLRLPFRASLFPARSVLRSVLRPRARASLVGCAGVSGCRGSSPGPWLLGVPLRWACLSARGVWPILAFSSRWASNYFFSSARCGRSDAASPRSFCLFV